MKRTALYLLAAGLFWAPVFPLRAAEAPPQLAQDALGVLQQYCYRCHGQVKKGGDLDVRDRGILLGKKSSDNDALYLVPGKPDQSRVYQRVKDDEMPPGGKKPTSAERDVLRRWIEAGAPFPTAAAAPRRAFQTEEDVLRAVRDYLRTLPASRRRLQRFFSLANLADDPEVTPEQLRLFRAALSKVVNSLSWQQDIVLPRALDRQGTVFVVDLAQLGWDQGKLWDEVLKRYPYGLTYKYDHNPVLKNLALTIAAGTGTDLACIRADWFIANATQPPLYHKFLGLPATATRLEKDLGINVRSDFLNNRLIRAGVTSSGVSKQNRLIERHATRYGAYWKSYDFKPAEESSDAHTNLVRFPLGPTFAGNPFADQAFVHAGGEIIFNLPNGLQGYLLVDGKDKRIDKAPSQVVEDATNSSGTSIVVNGLACMVCHQTGTKHCNDILRVGSALTGGPALAKLRRLHPSQKVLDQVFRKDDTRFLRALDRAVGPFLRVGADRGKDVRDFPEPIKRVTDIYFQDLSLERVARELSMEDPQRLRAEILRSQALQRLGLKVLAGGARIKRTNWEEPQPVQTQFQGAARELDQGIPLLAN
jgi:serine/threonine-protein kinase